MNTGEVINARTHAEFLNELLHRGYAQYMQCTLDLHNGYVLWFIKFNTGESKQGWTNSIVSAGNTIKEDYNGDPFSKLESHRTFNSNVKRLVFNVIENSTLGRQYKFCGVFECDKSSDNDHRIWNKIADSYKF